MKVKLQKDWLKKRDSLRPWKRIGFHPICLTHLAHRIWDAVYTSDAGVGAGRTSKGAMVKAEWAHKIILWKILFLLPPSFPFLSGEYGRRLVSVPRANLSSVLSFRLLGCTVSLVLLSNYDRHTVSTKNISPTDKHTRPLLPLKPIDRLSSTLNLTLAAYWTTSNIIQS